ncbi:MAG: exodeoxyribonuclease VII large subunit, partial [Sphingobacteriales bacterium]
IIQAFQAHSERQYDAIVIVRGGGSQSDFILFDNYTVGRTVAKCPIPIITGIGHQRNETVCDLMAHTSTKTPTQAAEFIIAHNRNFEDRIMSLQKSMIIKSQQLQAYYAQQLGALNTAIISSTRHRLSSLRERLVEVNQVTINRSKSLIFQQKNALTLLASQVVSRPKITIYNRLNDVQNTASNIRTFNAQFFKNKKGYLGHYISVIKLMSPDNILKKGFAIVKVNDIIVSDPDKILPGSAIEVILADNRIHATVERKQPYHGSDFNL